MDAALFAQMLSDKKVPNLKKLGYKYPHADIPEFIALLKNGFYKSVPLKDFHGSDLVYLEGTTQVHLSAAKILLTPQNSSLTSILTSLRSIKQRWLKVLKKASFKR